MGHFGKMFNYPFKKLLLFPYLCTYLSCWTVLHGRKYNGKITAASRSTRQYADSEVLMKLA